MNQLMLCNRSRTVATHASVLEPPLEPTLPEQAAAVVICPEADRAVPNAARLPRPTSLGDVRVKPQQHVQMIIHDREPADGDRKDLRKFLEPVLDPFLSVVGPFAEQETRGEHIATRSGTSGSPMDQSVENERSSSKASPGVCVFAMYTHPVRPSRSRCCPFPDYPANAHRIRDGRV